MFPIVLLQAALSSGPDCLGCYFEAPKSPHTKNQADCRNALQAGPETKSYLGYADPIFCDLYFFIASSLKIEFIRMC